MAWWEGGGGGRAGGGGGGGGGGGMYIKYFHLKIPSLFVLCSLLTSCVAESVKSCVRKKEEKLHDDKHQLLQQMTSAGQWQGSYFDYMTICLELTTFM